MEVFNEFSGMMKKSVGQCVEFSKKMQETATSALEYQVQATKEYMDWSMKTNSKLMEEFINQSSTARESMTENLHSISKTIEKSVPAAKKSA